MASLTKRYYRSLYQIAAAVNSAPNRDRVLDTIVETVAEALKARGCSIMLLTPDREALIHTAAHGLSDWYVRKGPVSTDRSISQALEGKPVAILDATADERVQYREQARQEGIASMLSVPMLLREDIVGVIRVYTGKQHEFTSEEVYFVQAVANLGAIALENARGSSSVSPKWTSWKRRDTALSSFWGSSLMTYSHPWLLPRACCPTYWTDTRER